MSTRLHGQLAIKRGLEDSEFRVLFHLADMTDHEGRFVVNDIGRFAKRIDMPVAVVSENIESFALRAVIFGYQKLPRGCSGELRLEEWE